jgi:hypothetical protein
VVVLGVAGEAGLGEQSGVPRRERVDPLGQPVERTEGAPDIEPGAGVGGDEQTGLVEAQGVVPTRDQLGESGGRTPPFVGPVYRRGASGALTAPERAMAASSVPR